MRIRHLLAALPAALTPLLVASQLACQDTSVFSMGQPPLWQPYVAGLGLTGRPSSGNRGSVVLGVHHPVLDPIMGLFGVSPEVYGAFGGAPVGGGLRLLAASPGLGIGLGPDWNIRAERVGWAFSYQTAVLRGGLLGHGTMLRLDLAPSPTGGHTLGVGIKVPVMQRFAGATRPRLTGARLPDSDGSGGTSPDEPVAGSTASAPDSALAAVAGYAELIRAYASVFNSGDEQILLRGGGTTAAGTYDAAIRAYASALARAFGAVAGSDTLGDSIARRARAGLMDDVIVPYDSLFGRIKTGGDGVRGLTSLTGAHFARWVRDSSGIPGAAAPAVLAVHARWLGIIERVHRELVAEWRDSRLVWLPVQLALTPDQFERQAQVDSLMARFVGRQFTDQNALTYLPSTDLSLEIARSIYAARDYHVVWVHDFPGLNPAGGIDNIGYGMVADVYLPALTASVKRLDSTAAAGGTPRLPTYMILFDQFYYEPRNGRLWMTILSDPMNARIRLPNDSAQREEHLRQRQQELRSAVAASKTLQSEAARLGGAAWLRRVVSVHVSITQPSDFSFRSIRMIPPIPVTPDNVARDHRKIVFYDVNEAYPYRGEMIMMGVGVGEEYTSTSWEDRGYRVRGPAALEARAAVRRLLAQNGFRAGDIPEPLRQVKAAPSDSVTERLANHGDYVGRALQVHNDVGFGPKYASVARALLYNLAPPGSVIIVPDGAWAGEAWGAMLAGAAARGCRVFIIAPGLANSPNPEGPLVAVEHDLLSRILQIADTLAPVFRQTGGELRLGIYNPSAGVTNPPARAREIQAGLNRSPWISQLIPFDAKTLAVLARAASQAAARGAGDASPLAGDQKNEPPDLHQKTQLIARPGAIAALVQQPGWDDVLAQSMQTQSQQTTRFADQLGWTTPNVDSAATRSNDALLRGYERAIPEADRERMSFYFSLGTENEDSRGLALDGEANLLVSGFHAAAGLVDFYYIMARSTWVTSQAELERHLPPGPSLMHRLAHYVRMAM